MSCKVRLYFYDSNSGKEVFDEECKLRVNDDDVDIGTFDTEETELKFSLSTAIPGNGGYEFEKWGFSLSGVSFTPTSTDTLTQDVTDVPYLEVRCYLKPKTVYITYDLENGKTVPPQEVKFNDPLVKLIDAPSKSKYVFAGWKSVEPVPEAALITSEYAEDTAYLKYDKFWKNDYSGKKIYYQVTENVAIEDNDGWDSMENRVFRLGAEGEVLYAALSYYTPRALEITMTAEWKSMTDAGTTLYPAGEIIYEDDDGNVIAREQVDGGVAVKVNDGKDFKGIAFDEWKDESGKTVKKGSTITTPTGGGGGGSGWSLRFHVSMAVNKEFWVRYDAGGGKPQPEPDGPYKAAKKGENPPTAKVAGLPSKKDIRGEYTNQAVCWLSNGSSYTPGESVVVDRDITLVADYRKPAKVNVSFTAANAGDVQVMFSPKKTIEYEFGKPYGSFPIAKDSDGNILALDENNPYTSGKDGKSVKETDEVLNPHDHTITVHLVPMKPVLLIANADDAEIWVDGKDFASYHLVRVKVNEAAQMTDPLPPVIAVRKGYPDDNDHKKEWYISSSMAENGTYDPADKKNANLSQAKVYVKWAQKVTFEVNKGYGSPEGHGFFAGQKYSDGSWPTDPKREAYAFKGWFTSSSGGDEVHKEDIVTTSKTRTLYAHWTRSRHTVTFDKGEGDWIEYKEKNYTIGEKYDTLPDAKKYGSSGDIYDFEGWFDDSDGVSRQVKVGDVVPQYSQRTLTAHFKKQSTKLVIFNAGDKGYFTGGGYDGMHWHEYVHFKPGVPYMNGMIDEEGKVMKDYSFPVPTGHDIWEFKKWLDSDGNEVTNSMTPENSSLLELHAHYEDTRVECTITFNPDGGTMHSADKIVFSGNMAGALPWPTKAGKTFTGWSSSGAAFAMSRRDGGGGRVTPTTVIEGDMTLKANWSDKIYLYYAIVPQ